ncbi:hypothetical protein TW76_01330 [Pseudoalteromonas ruthenica]|uniref:Uncharacterized protein n=1 Tax=Pseudoalteromonas ruthenica TaxID=151081 RepID=A0A0F4Q1U8_9GAMM|nr:hypothetical protein TW76_01330 [Pseudoalteromonas ruthenica]KJZ01299.1 hypothetical protein TW72_04275 [Pseudoalteromonas ruthenica]
MRSKSVKHSAGQGFTLIEVMIVVAIVGILVAVAYPSYAEHVRKAARAEAMSAVLETANRLEQFYVDNRVYTSDLTGVGVNTLTESDYYSISIALQDSAQAFIVTAEPYSGPALKDSDCGGFTVTDTGRRGVTVSSVSSRIDECWGN